MMALVGGISQDRGVLQRGTARSCSPLVVARLENGAEGGSTGRSAAEDGEVEESTPWPDSLEAEIDALLAEDADKQVPKPENIHAFSIEVGKALHTVSSDLPTAMVRGEELSGNGIEFEDFRVSANAKAEHMAVHEARVCYTERAPHADNGVGEPTVVKRMVCSCSAEEEKGGNAALALLPEPRSHESGRLVPVDTWSMHEVEERLDENAGQVTAVASSLETALRMAPLLASLNKQRIRLLRSGLSALHDYGIEVLIEIEMRRLDFSRAFRILERMVGGRRKAATLAALRQWHRAASIVTMEVAMMAAADTKAQPAAQLSFAGKQDKLSAQPEFHLSNPGADADMRMAPLLALSDKQRVHLLRLGLSAFHENAIEATIDVEMRDFELSRACHLLTRMMGGRRRTATLAALRQWRRAASISATEVVTLAAPGTGTQQATQLSLVQKQDMLSARSAFHSLLHHRAVGMAAKTEERRRREKHFLACYLLAEFAFSTERGHDLAATSLDTSVGDANDCTAPPTVNFSEAQRGKREFVQGFSQHPNNHGDTQGRRRKDVIAETDPETQVQLDIDRVLRELRTNVVESSTPTSPAADVPEVTPPEVTAPQRREVQQQQQNQRQQRGRRWRRLRPQPSSMREKGRPSEAEDNKAAAKMVVEDTWEIAADPRDHRKMAAVAAEAGGTCGRSVIEAKATGGEAGAEDGPNKRNPEVQSIVDAFVSLDDGPRRQLMRWFARMTPQVADAAVASDTVPYGDGCAERGACRGAGGDGFSEFWDPAKVGELGNAEEEDEVENEGDHDIDEKKEEAGAVDGKAEVEDTYTEGLRGGACLEGFDLASTFRSGLGDPGIMTSFEFGTGTLSSLDSTRTFSFGNSEVLGIQTELSSTGKGMLVEGKESVGHGHDGCSGIVPDQHHMDLRGTKLLESKDTFDVGAKALSVSASTEAFVLGKPPPAGNQVDEQVRPESGQQAKRQKRKPGRGGKGSRRRRDEAFWAKKNAGTEAAEEEALLSAGVLQHEGIQESDDGVGQREDRKTPFTSGTGALPRLGSTGIFCLGNSKVWGTQSGLLSTGKGMLVEGKGSVGHEHDGFGGIVPDQHQTDFRSTKIFECKETFDFRARALSVSASSEAYVLGTPPSTGAQAGEQVGLERGQQAKSQKGKSGRGGKGSRQRRDEAFWAKKDAEREAAEREALLSAGVSQHEGIQGDDDVEQREVRKNPCAFGTGAFSTLGSTELFCWGDSKVWGTQAGLLPTGKDMLVEGKGSVGHEHHGCGGIVPDQHQTDCLGAEMFERKDTFDFGARALSVSGWSEACALGRPPPACPQGDEQQAKRQKRKSGRRGKGSRKRRDGAHWAKKDAEREKLGREGEEEKTTRTKYGNIKEGARYGSDREQVDILRVWNQAFAEFGLEWNISSREIECQEHL